MKLKILQLDIARQKETLSYIKSYIDFAKSYGYNAILLYLENAVRTESTLFFHQEDTYSSAEISEIVDYAMTKGMDIIPAFENLAHLEKFFEYPQFIEISELKDGTEQGRGFSGAPYGNCGCVSNPKLYELLDRYIMEVARLFPCQYIHMGLDEPFDFADCELCNQRKSAGLTKTDLFYEHVMHSYRLVKNLGKEMLMWDDFFEYADIVERLPRDIIFCNWNYGYIADEPAGHWTNRIKKDWFRYYDELGFSYIFCVSAHRASSIYNLDTFTAYAEKYSPLGGLTTVWERTDGFYLSGYPFIALAGEMWSGKIKTEEEKISIYTNILGNRECAELLLSLNIPTYYSGFLNVGMMIENEYFLRYAYQAHLAYTLRKLYEFMADADGLAKDILTDIYNYLSTIYTDLQLQRIGTEIFEYYETGKQSVVEIEKKLIECQKKYTEIENLTLGLWKKYREGIVCYNDSLHKKYLGRVETVANALTQIKSYEKGSILYTELMLHDGYCTVRADIRVKYKNEEEKRVYHGRIKPSLSGFDCGGVYTLRFLLENKEIEYVIFGVFGEGALYPTHFRYVQNGKKYVAKDVEVLCGNVQNVENILKNDTQFAELGFNDGLSHFNDLQLSKTPSEIKINFRSL